MESPPPTPELHLDPRSLTPRDKRHYLMALISIAGADGKATGPELQVIGEAAKRIGFVVRRGDFKTYDAQSLAWGVRRRDLRRGIFKDLVRIAKADRKLTPSELKILRLYADTWEQELPEIPGLDWETIEAPEPEQLERISAERRSSLGERSRAIRAAKPGLRGRWILISAGIFLLLSVLAGFLAYSMVEQKRRTSAVANPEEMFATWFVVLSFLSAFCTGIMTGKLSKGRTALEPGLGVLLSLTPFCGFTSLASRSGAFTFLGLVMAGVCLAGLAYLGARVVEGDSD